MVLKKSNIVGIALLLALAVAPVSETFANAENNNLVQLDLKRSSNNSVDVTLFTSNNYNDNVLVRKKSDNKYVILIPKVQSNGYSSSSLTGVKDLVSNVDVKTVNDTNGGYTKVTLITTKPLDIKTNTQKSSPVTAEQKEYKTLIAQANAVKNNIAKPVSQPQKSVQKTEVTVNKAVQNKSVNKQTQEKSIKNTTTQKTKQEKIIPIKNEIKKIQEKPKVEKPEIKLKEINPEKTDRQLRKEYLAELIQETKQQKELEQAPQENLSNTNTIAGTTFDEPVKDISELPIERNLSIKEKIKNKLIAFKNSNLPKPIKFGLLPILGFIFILNLIKASLVKSKELKESFIEHLSKRSPIINTVKYNNIVNNSELSWQEKYQRYLDESAKPVPRANNKGHYTFIKTPAEPVQNDVIDQKRKALEQMLEETAYNSPNDSIKPEIVEVQNEEDAIQKTIKFKAFDSRKTSLNMTSRDKMKSRFKKYEKEIPLHEQKNIELGDSLLHSNRRSLKDANLKVEDVENRGIKMKFKPSEYIMSSIDEFFSIIDKEKSVKEIKQNITTNPITTNSKPTPKFDIPLPKKEDTVLAANTKQTNPITKLHNDTKSSYINGLIVKSGFNIDDNKGFYIVNLDGKSALIGKVNEEVFVLKKFDKNVTSPIQVRHDNANVYMVKAEGFKSLVEVNNDKMGVLIEL